MSFKSVIIERILFLTGDEEDDEDYMNFVVIDEFHVKFGPAVSSIHVAEALFCLFVSIYISSYKMYKHLEFPSFR